jgi:glycosyltransferase involved in cell wall biosynthesis
MRIAQVAPLYESVPPKYYGGTERVVSYLTEELVRQGHDVTLFASGDSETDAHLVPVAHRSLRLDKHCIDEMAHHVLLLERVHQRASQFDVVHFHLGYLHFPMARQLATPHVSTQHGRLDIADLQGLYVQFRDLPNVSISDDQRAPMPWMNWVATVHHGLSEDQYAFHPDPGSYFAFLGRISPEKRVDRAIEIATRLGVPLKIAAKVDKVDADYFETSISPLLRHDLVEYVGEIGEGEKAAFLGHAIAMLFPIDWPEPFGMVMIESMACGTPVIAYRAGSVPEVIRDGITGFVVDDLDEALSAAERVAALDRRRVREEFERSFSARRMADDYLSVYKQVIERPGEPPALRANAEAAAVATWKAPPDVPGRRPRP